MEHDNNRAGSLRALLVSLIASGVVACGGGGGGSAPTATPSPPPVSTPPIETTGTVGIFLTDGPTRDYDGVLITVLSILLLGDEGQEEIWSGEETFDLLNLEHFRDLFAINDEVPAGTYDKVRLRVRDVTLVRGEGEDAELIPVKLPANGKIDLNPKGSFEVPGGGVLLLEIDIDAKRSIHVVETGNGGFRFRPVVFVKVLGFVDTEKLVRIHGIVRDLDREEGDFELCVTEIVVDPRVLDNDFEGEHCIDVETDEDTGFFSGDDGAEVTLDQLSDDDEATVIGFLGLDDEDMDDADDDADEDDDTDSPFVLRAEVVEIGPAGSFLALAGTAQDSPDQDNDFPLLLDDGQGFESGFTATVETSDGTKVFSPDSEPLSVADVEADDRATVDAVFAEENILRTALIILDKQAAAPEEGVYAGIVADVDGASRSFQLTTDDVESGTACVSVPEDADVIQEPAEEGGAYTNVGFEGIDIGDEATVFGVEEEGCVTASTIILGP